MDAFETLEGIAERGDSEARLRHAKILASLGVTSVAGFAAFVALVNATPVRETQGCGLFLALLAGMVLPTAGAFFCASFWLAITGLIAKRALLTPATLLLTLSTTVGAVVFGAWIVALFFGNVLF